MEANGNVTLTVGGATPVVVGTIADNTYNALAITKNGTAFSLCLNGGTVFTTTATIASIANLEWLDNTGSGNLAQQANLTTRSTFMNRNQSSPVRPHCRRYRPFKTVRSIAIRKS